jgi:hypothetical protein
MYFVEAPAPFVDEQGYEILGACAHPRIAMELFRAKERAVSESERCPCFVRARPGRDSHRRTAGG